MFAATTIADEILDLKQQRRAILLAHHYQEPEIQELADVVGDSLELARKAREFSGDVIAFCGVWFMAETAKVLNPNRIVVVPDREASCSLVESCPVEPIREFRRRNPDYAIVSYINTSIEVKAESDILCTSRNAVKVVNSIPPEQPVLFLPDRQPGQLRPQGDRPREHEDLAGRLHRARHVSGAPRGRSHGWSIPDAKVVAHPGVPRTGAGDGGFHRLHFGHHRMVRRAGRAGIHRDDGKRRELLAGAGRARQALPLRGQRKLQLQRVPLHEAEHAGEAAGLPDQAWSRAWNCPKRSCAARCCRSSACSR